MEEKKKSNLKKIVVALIIIAALVLFYIWYFSGKEDSQLAVVPAGIAVDLSAAENISENGEIIKLLSTLRGINLDTEFLNSELFQGLHEVSIQLPLAQPGRSNPFSSF